MSSPPMVSSPRHRAESSVEPEQQWRTTGSVEVFVWSIEEGDGTWKGRVLLWKTAAAACARWILRRPDADGRSAVRAVRRLLGRASRAVALTPSTWPRVQSCPRSFLRTIRPQKGQKAGLSAECLPLGSAPSIGRFLDRDRSSESAHGPSHTLCRAHIFCAGPNGNLSDPSEH